MTSYVPPEWHARARILREEGLSFMAIAVRCGVNNSSVRCHLNENGARQKKYLTDRRRIVAKLEKDAEGRDKSLPRMPGPQSTTMCPRCGSEKTLVVGKRRGQYRCFGCRRIVTNLIANPSPRTIRHRAYRIEFPERHAAHQATRLAVMKGVLVMSPCAVCGSKKSEAHHEDYSKHLDVVWMCRLHHRQIHREGSFMGIKGHVVPYFERDFR